MSHNPSNIASTLVWRETYDDAMILMKNVFSDPISQVHKHGAKFLNNRIHKRSDHCWSFLCHSLFKVCHHDSEWWQWWYESVDDDYDFGDVDVFDDDVDDVVVNPGDHSGLYGCEVSADFPEYDTDIRRAHLHVFGMIIIIIIHEIFRWTKDHIAQKSLSYCFGERPYFSTFVFVRPPLMKEKFLCAIWKLQRIGVKGLGVK